MANSLTVKITEDGRRNAIATLIGVVDTADMNVPSAIALANFVNNDVQLKLKGLSLRTVRYSVTEGLSVLLAWNGNTPELMCALSGSNEMDRRTDGGYPPNMLASGYDGNINLTTDGFVAGRVYTFTVDLWMTKKYSK